MRSLYLPLIIFWKLATGQLCEAFAGILGIVSLAIVERATVSFLSVLAKAIMSAPNQPTR
jgi:hypothetical protein